MTALQLRFEQLADDLAAESDVSFSSASDRYGSESDVLTVNGLIFAMLTRGHLVVKLPAARVCELVEAGTGRPFDAGEGRPMREWLTVKREDDPSWTGLAREALTFVRQRPPR